MTSIASQMKDLKRRGIQKVLQGMGIAEKTSDDSHSVVNQNFVTLGNFITHLKQSVQGVNSSYDKTTKAQCNAASSLQAYVHSELADEADATTGELAEFFSSITDDEGSVHAVMLQEVTERFSYACNDIANTVLQDLMFTLEELVIKPIVRDEEQNAVTKELLEERKKLNLDYDSYKRAAQNAGPAEQERNEAKMRAARDRFDVCSKKVNEHLALRNYKRSKLIVHSILSVIQQYDKFFIASAALLQEVSGILNPLVEHYQMDERQFMDMMKMESRPVRSPVKDGASVPPAAKQTQRDTPSSPPPPYPHQKAPTPTVPPKPRSAQPNSPPLPKETPNGHADVSPPTAKSAPTLFPDLFGEDPSPKSSSIPNPTPTPATAPTPTPAPVPAPAPKSGPSLIDPWGDLGGDPTTTSNANKSNNNNTKKDATFVDLNFDTPAPTSPPPTQSSNMFGGDPFDIFGAAPLKPQTSMPSQPSMKPTPGNFNPPPQPQQPNNFFKPGATSFNGPPPQAGQPPKGNFYNMPPNYGAKPAAGPGGGFPGGPGFGGPQAGPYGQQQAGPGFGHGGFPGGPAGFGPQPGFGGHGGPPRPGPGGYGFGANGNPYSNPPNAGVSFIPETDGLDSATAAKLRVWAEKGAKKNLRALISSMHEVLWPDSGWEPKGLGELVSPSHVKKAYRQATLIVHPDKVSSCTDEQKIIAKKVFECLSECYEAFKNEPQ